MRPSLEAQLEARKLLAEHGEVRPQPVSDWKGAFPLAPQLAEYYNLVGPVDITVVGYGNPYFLPSLAKLWELQAGYRWNSLSGKAINDWKDDWLVVGDQGGDPFIFDRASSTVLVAHHGEGLWEPKEWFPNVIAMASCLAILGSVVRAAEDNFMDADFYVRQENRVRAVTRLTEVLGSRAKAEAIVGGAGWG
jgi:hypothetical protein